jgi:beta-lactamase class A
MRQLRIVAPLLLFLAVAALSGCASAQAPAESAQVRDARHEIAKLERKSGGRIGVALRAADGSLILAHRGDERFAMCSTFKTYLAAMVLSGDAGLDREQELTFTADDIPGWAPFARSRLESRTMTVIEAAEHAVTVSDNMAANLLLDAIGGPPALTRWMAENGDAVTRLDRTEPELNRNTPGDPRDTTTPAASTQSLWTLVATDRLDEADRDTLLGWLIASKTGQERIRAGLPDGMSVGDKTGTCGYPGAEAFNDVAVIGTGPSQWHVLAVYVDRPALSGEETNRVIAQVGRVASRLLRER